MRHSGLRLDLGSWSSATWRSERRSALSTRRLVPDQCMSTLYASPGCTTPSIARGGLVSNTMNGNEEHTITMTVDNSI